MPQVKIRTLLESRCFQQRRPVQTRSLLFQLLPFPQLRILHIRRLRPRRVHSGYLRFEREHARCPVVRVVDAGELEHIFDVSLVLLAKLLHVLAGRKVVIAVRHAEAALKDVWVILRRLEQSLRHPNPKHVLCLKIRVVQRIDIRAERTANHAGEAAFVFYRRHHVQVRLERSGAFRFDAGLIHVARIEVADLPRLGSCFIAGTRGFLNQGNGPLACFVRKNVAGSVAWFVGRNLRRLQPVAIGMGIEIISGSDGLVHASKIESRLCCCRRW